MGAIEETVASQEQVAQEEGFVVSGREREVRTTCTAGG